jgi:zinc/manganese transport system substrate-binding protein
MAIATRSSALAALAGLMVVLGSVPAAATVKVVATFSILGDMASEIGGDGVEVKTLVAPGGDAHVYQPTPADADALANAQLIVVNGLGMEGWIERLIKASRSKAPIVVASKGIRPQTMEEEEDKEASGKPKVVTDPHAWQNLANGQLYVGNIAEGLARVDPANAAGYRQRAERYSKKLEDLDAWVRQQMAQVPRAKRKIITSHDAFGYFGTAYGVTFMAPEGISTESEPSAAALAQLSDQIKREHIKALFIETMTDPRLVQTLARESGAVVGGTVYSDSLSEPGGPADTYVKMFRHNVPAMAAAMQKN